MPTEQGDGAAAPNNSNPFFCNVCGRSYSRVDHLSRHYRSHTNERPFPCETCGKHFARADLLRRHAAAHLNEPATKKCKRASSPPANRVSLACTACSAAKVKCDEGKPCHRCVQRGLNCELPAANHGVRITAVPAQQDPPGDTPAQFSSKPSGMQQQQLLRSESSAYPFSLEHGEQSHLNLAGDEVMRDSSLPGTNAMAEGSFLPTQRDSDDAILGASQWLNDDSGLGSFLADVMMPMDSPFNFDASNASNGVPEHNVLDFGTEHGVDFNDFDFALFNQLPPLPPQPTQQDALDDTSCPPSRADEGQGSAVDRKASEAFQRSLWRWKPNELDCGQCEQLNLSLPSDVGVTFSHAERPCIERLEQSARDKIMAMVMRTCDQDEIQQIVSRFPSANALDCLAQDFLFFHQARAVSYVHVPTFQPNAMKPELLAMTAACGAVRHPVSAVRNLGFALQESVRLILPKTWERDNSLTRNLQLLQSYLMWLDVGLWSGKKRKMEISESHLLPLVTMLRRAGRFRKSRATAVVPTPGDSPETLDKKWREWVENESFKRLAFAIVLHDAQVSMSFFAPPLITYAELSLGLPACETLWTAKSAQAWRQTFLSQPDPGDRNLPKVVDCLHNLHSILEDPGRVDIPFSKHIFLSMFWRQIWDCRQLTASTLNRDNAHSSTQLSLASSHWQQDLTQAIQNFRMTISETEPLSPAAAVVCEHLLLNICVSFDELSRFAGKEGMREARRTLPVLKQWVRSRESRQAVWHAGQILREARKFSPGALRNFSAIVLYHAGLTLWAYGLLSSATAQPGQKASVPADYAHETQLRNSMPKNDWIALLDGEDTINTQKFIALHRTSPALRRHAPDSQPDQYPDAIQLGAGELVFLDNPDGIMKIVTAVLQRNHASADSRGASPLVENLIKLMQDLGHAALRINDRYVL